MANNIGPDLLSPALWSARVQKLLKNSLCGAAICNTEERVGLKFGYRTHRPYTGDVYAQTYTKGVAPTFLNMNATDEYLDVDQAKIIPMYLDDIDEIQNKYKTMDIYSQRMTYQMRNQIDQKIFSLVPNALLGNTTPFTLDTTNVSAKYGQAKADLFNNGCEDTIPWYAVADADTISTIEEVRTFNGFKISDDTLVNGYGLGAYLGDWKGLKMFKSQNLKTSVDIVWSADPANPSTLIINGVTFNFVTPIGSAAGNVLLNGAIDTTMAALVNAINNSATGLGTTWIQLSDADRAKLASQGIAASYVDATNTLTITGFGKMTIAGTQATGTVGTQTMVMPVGQMGAIDLVVQKDVSIEILRVTDGRRGYNITAFDLYGVKMFREGAQRTYAMTVYK